MLLLRGIAGADAKRVLIPSGWILWGGIGAYVLLLWLTWVLLKRPVTTELFLIMGWAMLAFSEVNALYGTELLRHRPAICFAVVIAAATLTSLVCYVLYYHLNSRAGYLDGMVPLILVALVMTCLAIALIRGFK